MEDRASQVLAPRLSDRDRIVLGPQLKPLDRRASGFLVSVV